MRESPGAAYGARHRRRTLVTVEPPGFSGADGGDEDLVEQGIEQRALAAASLGGSGHGGHEVMVAEPTTRVPS